jgi:hypothetical protein
MTHILFWFLVSADVQCSNWMAYPTRPPSLHPISDTLHDGHGCDATGLRTADEAIGTVAVFIQKLCKLRSLTQARLANHDYHYTKGQKNQCDSAREEQNTTHLGYRGWTRADPHDMQTLLNPRVVHEASDFTRRSSRPRMFSDGWQTWNRLYSAPLNRLWHLPRPLL